MGLVERLPEAALAQLGEDRVLADPRAQEADDVGAGESGVAPRSAGQRRKQQDRDERPRHRDHGEAISLRPDVPDSSEETHL